MGDINKSPSESRRNLWTVFNISTPWSPLLYIQTIRMGEYFILIFWVLKDIGWTQKWQTGALFFATIALAAMFMMLLRALFHGMWEEAYMNVATMLWFFGNYWWMIGEVQHDDDVHVQPEAAKIFLAALCWHGFYYIILKPFRLLTTDAGTEKECEEMGLHPRLPFLENWRQYEYLHSLFWLGKDYSWNTKRKPLWIVFTVPTLVIAGDMLYRTMEAPGLFVEFVHYISTLLWVLGNMTWAIGEVFYTTTVDDNAHPMWDNTYKYIIDDDTNGTHHSDVYTGSTYRLFRWWSSWILFSALIPLILLYALWIGLTYSNEPYPGTPKKKGHVYRDHVVSVEDEERNSKQQEQSQQQQQPQQEYEKGFRSASYDYAVSESDEAGFSQQQQHNDINQKRRQRPSTYVSSSTASTTSALSSSSNTNSTGTSKISDSRSVEQDLRKSLLS